MNTEEFEALSPEEQEKVFHQTSFKEKGDLLLHSHQPQRLVRSLSQEELYLTAKEMDISERSEVLRYATLPQLFFVSDIDCWKGDRIHPSGFVRWLESLYLASPQSLLSWLIEMDYETVTAGLKTLIRVIKPHHEYASDELLGDTPYFTLDDQYFICVEEDNLSTVKQAFEVLFENHRGKYVAILEGVLADLDDELEEEGYQRREIRLEERGFPAPERARRIYRPISAAEFEEYSHKEKETKGKRDEISEMQIQAPHYALVRAGERLFLDEVLLYFRDLDARFADGIQEELAWLSNKVIACDGIDFSNEDRVRSGIERARWFVNIGLELLTGRDPSKATGLMKKTWLEAVFRTAVTELLKLQNGSLEVVKKHWNGNRASCLEFLTEPYDTVFRGLFQKIPQCYDETAKPGTLRLRDFYCLEDVRKTEIAIEHVRSVHDQVNKQMKVK